MWRQALGVTRVIRAGGLKTFIANTKSCGIVGVPTAPQGLGFGVSGVGHLVRESMAFILASTAHLNATKEFFEFSGHCLGDSVLARSFFLRMHAC